MEENYKIRKALNSDSAGILGLVKELAVYEMAANQVNTTVEDYKKGLDTGLFDCFVAELADGKIAGIALFFPYFSTWNGKTLYLEDFIVLEEYRRLGLGKALFEAYLEEAKRLQVNICKWQVLDWNELAKSFYRKYDTQFYTGWENGVIRIK
jgi:GNAT superfamily N-acetyltransferase